MKSMQSNGVRESLSERDRTFSDYREQGEMSSAADRDV
jgi:hypothetical protein